MESGAGLFTEANHELGSRNQNDTQAAFRTSLRVSSPPCAAGMAVSAPVPPVFDAADRHSLLSAEAVCRVHCVRFAGRAANSAVESRNSRSILYGPGIRNLADLTI